MCDCCVQQDVRSRDVMGRKGVKEGVYEWSSFATARPKYAAHCKENVMRCAELDANDAVWLQKTPAARWRLCPHPKCCTPAARHAGGACVCVQWQAGRRYLAPGIAQKILKVRNSPNIKCCRRGGRASCRHDGRCNTKHDS